MFVYAFCRSGVRCNGTFSAHGKNPIDDGIIGILRFQVHMSCLMSNVPLHLQFQELIQAIIKELCIKIVGMKMQFRLMQSGHAKFGICHYQAIFFSKKIISGESLLDSKMMDVGQEILREKIWGAGKFK